MTGTPVDLNNGWGFEHGAITGSNMWGALPYYYTFDPSGNIVSPAIGVPLRGSRDMFRTGGMQNWDMSLFKNIPLGERYSVQLRLEAFNVFNHPNFNNRDYGVNVPNFPNEWSPSDPVVFQKSPTWGQPVDTYGGVGGFRVLQLAAKFFF